MLSPGENTHRDKINRANARENNLTTKTNKTPRTRGAEQSHVKAHEDDERAKRNTKTCQDGKKSTQTAKCRNE